DLSRSVRMRTSLYGSLLLCAKRKMAAVTERRRLCLFTAAERDGECLRHGVTRRPMLGPAMRAVAIGLPRASPAGAPDDQFAGRKLRPVGSVGGIAHALVGFFEGPATPARAFQHVPP